MRPDSCSLPQKVENKIWRKREKAPLEDCQLSIPASHSPKRKKKSEAARFSFNSFLESSEAVAQSLIFTELDHKWDPACCSVICHRIARMRCPNMERMSCPKHLFLAVSFPALRSKLQLIDKHRSWTPSAPQPSDTHPQKIPSSGVPGSTTPQPQGPGPTAPVPAARRPSVGPWHTPGRRAPGQLPCWGKERVRIIARENRPEGGPHKPCQEALTAQRI